TTPTEPEARAQARVAAEREYRRVGIENIRAEPAGWLKRRVTRGLFVLWAADLPIRFSDINRAPTASVRAIWLVDAAIDVLALAGLAALVRAGRTEAALLLAAPLVYVTAVHFPLLTEARQSLPVKAIVVALAAIAVTTWRDVPGSERP